jgi:hypothetical protein
MLSKQAKPAAKFDTMVTLLQAESELENPHIIM